MLALAGCTLDTSGFGDGDDGSSENGGSSSAASTVATTMPSTTTAPTSGNTDETSGPTTVDPTTGDESIGSSTDPDTDTGETTGAHELGPFDDPVAVFELNSSGIDDDPTLRGDMLEIYFSSTRDGRPTEDIYRATRGSTNDPFQNVQRVDELSRDDSADASAEISLDGLVISFSGGWPGGPGGNDPMIAIRESTAVGWGMPMRIDELSTIADEASLVVTEDALVGYFCRDFGGGPYWELMRTVRNDDDAPWEMPQPLDTLNGDGRDCAPWVNADDTELWFASVRIGGEGAEDIWRVPVDDGIVGEPTPVAELNELDADEDPWLSPDGHTIFFASDRGAGFEIYTATRR
jgi:WD40-like Beta Propeller Repeat